MLKRVVQLSDIFITERSEDKMKLLLFLCCLWLLSYKGCFAQSLDHCLPCLSRKCNAEEEMICRCGNKTVKMDNKGQISYPKATVSLGIAVDITYSMRDEIKNIQKNIKAIVEQNAHDTIFNKFVLVAFQDDERLHINRTGLISVNVTVIKKWVDNLSASGGDSNCNEDSMWGLKETALNVSRGSVILLYTDAGAEDFDMEKEVTDLLIKKDIRVVWINTDTQGACGKTKGLPGRYALRRVILGHGGKIYNVTGDNDKFIMQYIQSKMPHGLSFIRTMPKTMEELKTAASNSCNCNAHLLNMTCYNIFEPKDKKVDGKLLKLKADINYISDSFVGHNLVSRVIDLDTDTSIYATARSSSIWLLIDLMTAVVVDHVYLVRRKFTWASGDKEKQEFRKYSVGLTSDNSVWNSFAWSKFRKCGSTYEGPPTGNSENFKFVCGLPNKFKYVSAYKEAVSGMPNKMILTEVVVYQKSSAGSSPDLMHLKKHPVKLSTNSSGMSSQNEMRNILDNNKNTFIQLSVEPTDHWLVVDTGTEQVITKIVVYRRRDNGEARKNFNSISAGISQLNKLDTFKSASYRRCGDMYKGPPANSEYFISFYCHLEAKSRFVGLLKLATKNFGNTFEISELEVHEYDFRA